MHIRTWLAVILGFLGSVLLLIALLAGVLSIEARMKRQQHGPGLMFADVELLGVLAIIRGALGGIFLFSVKKLSSHRTTERNS